MPYLPTPNAFLEQSSLLLEAYPDDTRITTKYSCPSPSKSNNTTNHKISKRKPTTEESTTSTSTQTFATLTLKTFNPVTGICLKYKTNKAAEVGRLISGLGKLAAGVKITTDDNVAASTPAAGTGVTDVEMSEAPPVPVQSQVQSKIVNAAAVAASTATVVPSSAGGGSGDGGSGGGGKKKKGKGKK